MHRCGILAIALLLAVGHSAGMQTIAWIGMFAERVEAQSIPDAITATLDGSRPCALCNMAKDLAAIEANNANSLAGTGGHKAPVTVAPLADQKWLIEEPQSKAVASTAHVVLIWPKATALADGFASEPPTPPPRVHVHQRS
jgi:hypothetical protein